MPGTYISPAETGWYYLQSRYYDPVTGRFINADEQINGTMLGANLFAYCENNPVNMADPNGNAPYMVVDGPRNQKGERTYILVDLGTNKTSVLPTKMSDEGVKFLASYEGGFKATPYDDGYGNPTIGYGHLIKPGENFTSITQEEALTLLSNDLASFEKSVMKYSISIGVAWSQNEYDAFVDLAYNAGYYYQGVMDDIVAGMGPHLAFSQVIYSNGRKSLGLYRRRMDEADMFCNGTYNRTYREW